MKKSNLFLSFCIVLFASYSLFAQYELAMVTTPVTEDIIIENAVSAPQVDKSAVTELSDFLAENVDFPFEELSYLNKVSVLLQVSINKDGKVIDSRIVSSSHPQAGANVLKALKKDHNFTPISINGVASTRTLQIPLIFR